MGVDVEIVRHRRRRAGQRLREDTLDVPCRGFGIEHQALDRPIRSEKDHRVLTVAPVRGRGDLEGRDRNGQKDARNHQSSLHPPILLHLRRRSKRGSRLTPARWRTWSHSLTLAQARISVHGPSSLGGNDLHLREASVSCSLAASLGEADVRKSEPSAQTVWRRLRQRRVSSVSSRSSCRVRCSYAHARRAASRPAGTTTAIEMCLVM